MKTNKLIFIFSFVFFGSCSYPIENTCSTDKDCGSNGSKCINKICTITVGDQGSQGIQGPIGQIGPQGLRGLQGETGLQGFSGPIGLQGIQGPIGPQGIQGPIGPQGLTGLQGLIGLPGLKGERGDIGLTGLEGLRGNIGPQGEIGLQGIPGPQGVVSIGDGIDQAASGAKVLSLEQRTAALEQVATNITIIIRTADIRASGCDSHQLCDRVIGIASCVGQIDCDSHMVCTQSGDIVYGQVVGGGYSFTYPGAPYEVVNGPYQNSLGWKFEHRVSSAYINETISPYGTVYAVCINVISAIQ